MALEHCPLQPAAGGLPLPDLVRARPAAEHLTWPPVPASPAARLRWRRVIQEMREDGSLARILHQYDFHQAPDEKVSPIAKTTPEMVMVFHEQS